MIKTIKRKDMDISCMTLGAMQLGANYGIANKTGMPGQAESYTLLRQAFDNGVTSVDTARAYGESEERIGGFLKSNQNYKPYITTKIRVGISAPTPGGTLLPPDKMAELENALSKLGDKLEKIIFDEVETSLKKLAVSRVNCIMLHRPDEMMTGGKNMSRIMGKLITKGYADEAGVSVYLPAEAEAMMQYDEYTAIQLPMNLFDQKMIYTGVMQKLKERDCLVFVRSVFLQGVFFLDPDNTGDPLLDEHAAPHIRTLRRLANEESVGAAQLAISFIRDTPGVSSLVLGCETKEQVLDNINLMNGPPISGKTMEAAGLAFKNVDLASIMAVLSRPKQQ